jgi:hypothetical protein
MKLKSFEEFRKEVVAELGDAIQEENITNSDINHLAHLEILCQQIESGRFPIGYKQPKFYQ